MPEDQNITLVDPKQKPRTGENAEKPGKYNIISRLSKSEFNPGEVATVEIYITGYGEISNAKIAIYISSQFFDPESSKIFYDITKGENTTSSDHVITFDKSIPLNESNIVGLTGGINLSDNKGNFLWNEPSLFMDINENKSRMILTEKKAKHAPIELLFKTTTQSYPGKYSTKLVLTYFNGIEWCSSSDQLELTITSWFQRNQTSGLIIASVAGMLAIINPVIVTLNQIFLYINRFHSLIYSYVNFLKKILYILHQLFHFI